MGVTGDDILFLIAQKTFWCNQFKREWPRGLTPGFAMHFEVNLSTYLLTFVLVRVCCYSVCYR